MCSQNRFRSTLRLVGAKSLFWDKIRDSILITPVNWARAKRCALQFRSTLFCMFSVCQTLTFERFHVGPIGSSYLHITCIFGQCEPSSYMKVIGSRLRSQDRKRTTTGTNATANYHSVCAVVPCPRDTQKLRHGSQHPTTSLQVSPSWQDDLRCQCLVGVHHGCWQAASWGINLPSCSRWSLPNRRTKLATVGCWRGRCSLCTNSGESTSCTARTVTSPYLP